MTSQRFVLLAVLLMGSAAFAHADGVPVDPQMDIQDPPCTEGCPPAVETTFSFTSNASGGGFIQRTNGSGTDWMSLLIAVTTNGGTLPQVPPTSITCLSNAFINCQTSDAGGGVTDIYLSGVGFVGDTSFPGIVNNDAFSINLNDLLDGVTNTDPNGSGGWGANRTFDATANATNPLPEPATLTLLGIGLGTLLLKRRFPRKSDSRN